ncbi:MAG: SDH family Clp fold serine proteinase [Candidatus Helarchaeota archaeon]
MFNEEEPTFSTILKEGGSKEKESKIKETIKGIQRITKRKLIVYITNAQIPNAMIRRIDIFGFEDILSSINHQNKGDLLINSPGGEPNAAEKILIMCKKHFKDEFNVIVPDFAKSAATMISLGSDKILMGYSAELGPVDPQLLIDPNQPPIPAQAFLSGLEYIRTRINDEEKPDPLEMYLPLLQKLNMELIIMCHNSIAHAKELTEKWLSEGMLKHDKDQAKLVAQMLSEGKVYKSHGKVIDFEQAKNVLKLNVEEIDRNSPLWKLIWELYCRCYVYLNKNNGVNLFGSENIILTQKVKMIPLE